jgi:hypothetical protein
VTLERGDFEGKAVSGEDSLLAGDSLGTLIDAVEASLEFSGAVRSEMECEV